MKTHDEFEKALLLSRESVSIVCNWLDDIGFNAKILPSTIAPSYEERHKHIDMGDIEINQRVEVKHLPNVQFNSIADFPFKNAIVDEKYKLDKYKPATLYGYVCVNKDMTGAILIPTKTKKYWFNEIKFDKKENMKRTFTVCPVEHVKYINFNI